VGGAEGEVWVAVTGHLAVRRRVDSRHRASRRDRADGCHRIAQRGADDPFRADFVPGQLGGDPALPHDQDPVRHPGHLLGLAGVEQHCRAALGELADPGEDVPLGAQVHPRVTS